MINYKRHILYLVTLCFTLSFIVVSCGDDTPAVKPPTPTTGGDKPGSGDNPPASPNTLSISPTEAITFEAKGGSKTIEVTTNAKSWEAVSDQKWCQVTSITNNTFAIEAAQNQETQARETATITVSAGEASPVTLKVDQKGAAISVVVQSPPSFNASSASDTVVVKVTTQKDWDAKASSSETDPDAGGADWCVVVADKETGQVIIQAKPNITNSDRTAYVTISAGDESKTIEVKQKAAEGNVFAIWPPIKEIYYDAVPGPEKYRFEVITNMSSNWYAQDGPGGWVNIDENQELGYAEFSVTMTNEDAIRTGDIMFIHKDDPWVDHPTITFIQRGAPAKVWLDPVPENNAVHFSYQGGNVVYDVNTNFGDQWDVSVELEGEEKWCLVAKKSFMSLQNITVYCIANNSITNRKAKVIVSGIEGAKYEFEVTQKGARNSDTGDFDYGEGSDWD